MNSSSMLFQGVGFSAAFLWRPVGGSRPHSRAVPKSRTFTWSKSERREVRFLPSTPFSYAQLNVAADEKELPSR